MPPTDHCSWPHRCTDPLQAEVGARGLARRARCTPSPPLPPVAPRLCQALPAAGKDRDHTASRPSNEFNTSYRRQTTAADLKTNTFSLFSLCPHGSRQTTSPDAAAPAPLPGRPPTPSRSTHKPIHEETDPPGEPEDTDVAGHVALHNQHRETHTEAVTLTGHCSSVKE